MLLKDELQVVPTGTILQKQLDIPNYQRPYKWSIDSALTLFNDLYFAFNNKIKEYRIGSAILYKNDEGKYYIVDGQQRITTLSILFYFLDKNNCNNYKLLTKQSYNSLSKTAIINNALLLKSKCKQLKPEEIKKFSNYILTQCTFVQIVTNDEQESFQFFDSQNSRGRSLFPHDLLKSYHLREMNEDSLKTKIEIINEWEKIPKNRLAIFFANSLYPLVRWYRGLDGFKYSTKKIQTFKGIKQNNNLNFSIYHKAANLYIEHFNKNEMYELTEGNKISQFQLTQPLISGRRFFLYVLYYYQLHKKITDYINSSKYRDITPDSKQWEIYIKNLFINIIIFFVDRFNFKALNENYLFFFYRWAYSLRLVMEKVSLSTINKYAKGNSDRINRGINLFYKISEMQKPEEIENILLDQVARNDNYKDISDAILGDTTNE